MGVTGTGLQNHLSGRTTVAYPEGVNEPRAHSLRVGEWYQRASFVLWRIFARLLLVQSVEDHKESPTKVHHSTRGYIDADAWTDGRVGR